MSLSQSLGIPESKVASGIAALLRLAKDKIPPAQFDPVLAMIPGAADLLNATPAPAADGSSGLFGGLAGLLGGQLGDSAAAFAALQKAGIPAEKILPFAQSAFLKIQEIAGPEVVAEMAQHVPALKSLLSPKA